jgi:hypothetical protein
VLSVWSLEGGSMMKKTHTNMSSASCVKGEETRATEALDLRYDYIYLHTCMGKQRAAVRMRISGQ